ncbi:UNVERIFIED_CONTAM: hypothetical protein H355_010419 [Colinus virginianus]|nr:hypothetical protein H355_010419 [Colinus virginianus]
MALDVAKSLSEASLSHKVKCYGRWDCTDGQTDCPELASHVHQLLGAEEGKAALSGTESLPVSGRSGLAASLTAPASRLARMKAGCLERQSLTCRAELSGDSSRHLGHLSFLEQQQSSTEESGTAVVHHISASRWSQAPRSPSSSPLDSLPQQTLPSPKSPAQSRSRSSFSTLSLEENSVSEQQEGRRSQSSAASLDVPSAATWELCRRQGATGGRTMRARRALSPLLPDCVTVEHVRKMSPYQADYWACAIPDSLPPSPDRQSPHWNPNKEYEDLLDYTYPLKPKHKLGKAPEPFLHDSGVDLDSFSLSPEGTFRSTSIYGIDRGRWSESLAQCIKEFRKDVADHRSLTESVLRRGAALLECMASNSPALKDTLGLIEKQSEELENHAERLYQSVLAAVGPMHGESSSSAQQAAAQAAAQAAEAQRESRVRGEGALVTEGHHNRGSLVPFPSAIVGVIISIALQAQACVEAIEA